MVTYPSIGLSHFGGYQVFTSSLRREEEIKNIAILGGFGVVEIKEESLDTLVKVMEDSGDYSLFMVNEAKKIKPGPIIMIQSLMFEFLSTDETLAMILHEIGHIRLNHLKTIITPEDYLRKEMEADAYSAGIVGKENYKRALEKLFETNVKLGLGRKGEMEIRERLAVLG